MAIKSLKGLLSFSFSSLSSSSASSSSGVLKRPIYKQKLSVSKLEEAARRGSVGSLFTSNKYWRWQILFERPKVLSEKETYSGKRGQKCSNKGEYGSARILHNQRRTRQEFEKKLRKNSATTLSSKNNTETRRKDKI